MTDKIKAFKQTFVVIFVISYYLSRLRVFPCTIKTVSAKPHFSDLPFPKCDLLNRAFRFKTSNGSIDSSELVSYSQPSSRPSEQTLVSRTRNISSHLSSIRFRSNSGLLRAILLKRCESTSFSVKRVDKQETTCFIENS